MVGSRGRSKAITTGPSVLNAIVLEIQFVMKILVSVSVHQTLQMIACLVLLMHMDIIILLVAMNANAQLKEQSIMIRHVILKLANANVHQM